MHGKSQQTTAPRILLKVQDARTRASIGNTKLYQLISEGKIAAYKIGRGTRICEESLNAYLESLPRVGVEVPDARAA